MPWRVVANHPSCPASKPFGVVNKQTGQLERGGCHETRDMANRQLAALYAKEPQMQTSSRFAVQEWKSVGGDSGELEGYVSVFGNVDQGGDVVLPGAFKRTLANWEKSKQPLPLIADHDLTTDGVIGSVVQAKEDQVGLWIRARFSSDPKAQSVRTKMLEGHVKGMSFTYEAIKHYAGTIAGKAARFLEELKLYEATVTPFPMNLLAVGKAKADPPTGLGFSQFTESMINALGITYEPAKKAAVDLLVVNYHLYDPPADEQGTPADTEESPVGTVDDYASRFVTSALGPRDDAPDGNSPPALVDPLISLKVARQNADADRLEAEINSAKEANR